MKFRKVIKNAVGNAELYIYGDIVDDSWNMGWENDPSVYPMNIRTLLNGFEGQDLDVHVNSGGGHFFAGVAISNMLKAYKGKTTAMIDAVAASAASIICFGCNDIVIPANASLMIHKPEAMEGGTADDLRKCADMLDALQGASVATYMTKAVEGVTPEQVDALINEETWLIGAEAQKYFNVQVSEAVQVLNCTGNMLNHWSKLPAEFRLPAKPENQDERLKQEIEIALAII